MTSAEVAALISAVTYSNNSGNPSTADRSITFTLFADNATTTATTLVHVAAVNDAPVAAVPAANYQAIEQTALNLKNTGLHVSDVDSFGIATVTLSVDSGITRRLARAASAFPVTECRCLFTGTFATIEALLNTDATSTVSYINDSDAPPASATLSLVADRRQPVRFCVGRDRHQADQRCSDGYGSGSTDRSSKRQHRVLGG